MLSTGIAYLLWFLSGFGALGFHRFYLGKIPTGILWAITGGLGMVGSIYDLLTLPSQVHEANMRNALYSQLHNRNNINTGIHGIHVNGEEKNWRYAGDAEYKVMNGQKKKETPEIKILKIAKENSGILTVSEVAISADISIDEAKKCLDDLVSKGFAELRVKRNGSLVYVIPDLAGKDEPFEDI